MHLHAPRYLRLRSTALLIGARGVIAPGCNEPVQLHPPCQRVEFFARYNRAQTRFCGRRKLFVARHRLRSTGSAGIRGRDAAPLVIRATEFSFVTIIGSRQLHDAITRVYEYVMVHN